MRQLAADVHRLTDRGDYKGAEAAARQLEAQVEALDGADSSSVGNVLGWLANAIDMQGREKEGEPLLRKALAIQEAALGEKSADTGAALVNLAENLDKQKRFQDAEAYYRRALSVFERTVGPDDDRRAAALMDVAKNLKAQGRFQEALDFRVQALLAKAGADTPQQALDLRDAANSLLETENYLVAEKMLRTALAVQEKAFGPDGRDVEPTLMSLGESLEGQGRTEEAEAVDRRALAIAEKTSGPRSLEVSEALNNLAVDLGREARGAEVVQALRRALAIDINVLPSNDPRVGFEMGNPGSVLDGSGDEKEAEALLDRALAIDNDYRQQSQRESGERAFYLTALGGLYYRQGRLDKQESLLRQALAEQTKVYGPDSPQTAGAEGNLAVNLADQGRYDEVDPLARHALAVMEKRLGPDHPTTAQGKELYANFLRQQGKPAEAVSLLRESGIFFSHRVTEEIGRSSGDHESADAGYTRGTFSYLTSALWSWSLAGGGSAVTDRPPALAREAFEAAQRAESGSAAAALARAVARSAALAAGAGDAAATRESLLREQKSLETQEENRAAAGDATGFNILNGRLTALEPQLRRQEDELRDHFPAYWSLVSPEPVSVAELQSNDKLLRPDEAVVLVLQIPPTDEYFPSDDSVYVFVVTKTEFAWARASMSLKALSAAVAKLRCELDPANCDGGAVPTGLKNMKFDRALAYQLYQALFGDPKVAALIASKPSLLVSVNGALTALPFGVLVTAPPVGDDGSATDLRATHWLIRDKTLSTLPSVASLKALRLSDHQTDTSAATEPFLGFAPTFEGQPGEVRSAPTDAINYISSGQPLFDSLRHLPSLSNRPEVEAMQRTLGGTVFEGGSASKTEVYTLDENHTLAHARIIAFATHGLLTGDFGLTEPALVLTPPEQLSGSQSETDNGLLAASDVVGLHLSADWVVLSACNTGSGARTGAEGLSGLARAFFYAGAKSLLVSHWRIRDDAASRLTTETIRIQHENTTSSHAGALREAQLRLIDDTSEDGSVQPYSHPSLWAPFVLIGD